MSTTDERDGLTRRGFALEYASMAWMTVEAGVAIAAGIIASSIALVGFGLDSVIEFAAAVIVIWPRRRSLSSCRARILMLTRMGFQ
jgi:divalent metal cation (Fe/Co/Zn/Cd) transporter